MDKEKLSNVKLISSLRDIGVPPLLERTVGGKLTYKALDLPHEGSIGRVLICHLLIEHYLTKYIEIMLPAFFDVESAQLSFSKKLALVSAPSSPIVALELIEPIKCLNSLRNRIAHRIELGSKDDLVIFSDIKAIDAFIQKRSTGATEKHVDLQSDGSLKLDPNQKFLFFNAVATVELFTSLACATLAGLISGSLELSKEVEPADNK